MKCFKPKVGQTLYSLNVGNACRDKEQKLTKVIVTKVGSKYFTCKEDERYYGIVYHIEDWTEKTEYISDSCLYVNPQEWENAKEEVAICKMIESSFKLGHNIFNISLENLKKIKDLLDEGEK